MATTPTTTTSTATAASLSAANQDYTNILFRAATSTEANTLGLLIDNGSTLAQAANSLAIGTEATTYVDPVVRLYQAAFNRVPDYAGLKAWVNAYRNGLSLQSIAQGFIASAEFASVFSTPTPSGATLAGKLYSNVLNRPADDAGFQAWSNFLGTTPAVATMAQALLGFANSPEFVADSAQQIATWQQAYGLSNAYNTSLYIGDHGGPTVPVAPTYTATVNGGQADPAHNKAAGIPGSGATLTGATLFNGSGSGSSLLISDLGSLSTTNYGVLDLTDPIYAGLALSNVGSATIASNEGVVANVTSWGVSSLKVTSTGTVVVTAPGTTAVTVTNTVPVAGPLFVTGGSSVTVTENNGSLANTGNLVVVGTAGATTSVSVTQTQTATTTSNFKQVAQVYIVDPNSAGAVANGYPTPPLSSWTWAARAGTCSLTTVSLDGCGNNVLIEDDALTSLTMADSTGYVSVFNTGAALTLTLTLNNVSYKSYNASLIYATGTVGTVTKTAPTALKIVTTGADSSIYLNDISATSLSVSGTRTLDLTATTQALTAVTAVSIGGSAGLKINTSAAGGFGAVTSINAVDDSGAINAQLDPSKATFLGGGGADFITITADPKFAVTGGPAPGNELVLATDGSKFTATGLGVDATHFTITGFNSSSITSFDFSLLPLTAAIDVMGLGGDMTWTNVPVSTSTETPLTIDAATGHALIVKTNDAAGANDSVAVTLGTAGTSAMTSNLTATASGFTALTGLTLEDSTGAAGGIGTVNITSLCSSGQAITITALTDPGLQALTISGTGALALGGAVTTAATTVTITNVSTSATASLVPISDAGLTTLTLNGTGPLSLAGSTLTGLTTLNINNTGNLTLGTLGSTNGLTVNGAATTGTVSMTLTGATGVHIDTVVLGNGANTVIDPTITSTVNVTVGSGLNRITAGAATTDSTGLYNITLNSSGGDNIIYVGTGGTSYATAANFVITGAVAGDTLSLRADATAAGTGASNAVVNAAAAGIGALEVSVTGAANAHKVFYSQIGGNTYLVDSFNGSVTGADTAVVEIVGTHTFTATGGVVTLVT